MEFALRLVHICMATDFWKTGLKLQPSVSGPTPFDNKFKRVYDTAIHVAGMLEFVFRKRMRGTRQTNGLLLE
jgi:hypothetical protein